MEAAKKSQQPPSPTIPRADDCRSWRSPLTDLTNDLAPSKGRPPRTVACHPRIVAAGEGDAPGTCFSSPLSSSSGIGIHPVISDRSDSGPTRKCKRKEVATSGVISPSRMSKEDVSDVASSKQALLLPFLDDSRVEATKEDAPGTCFDLSGLDSTPSHDFLPSFSGHDFKFGTIYCRRNSKGKEMPSSSASSHTRRSSRIRKRPGEVEDRAASKSCIIPSRKVRNTSSSKARIRSIYKSCSLPNKRKQLYPPPDDVEKASESLQEFIRQQKSYFAEVDAFELPEEEASDDDLE
ncbi:hypothetical protein MLD38_024115 [Melastoma candidum]|uniref:Uncharacterized protein n=1 Tax=Melastoma candidum TaxID=119954 RepID=A0ACB9NUQ1_9MYRT|nr:hypothetical protein MLD38_024115 [Melastoma candidum]